MSSTLYSTAETPAGSLAQRLHFQRLEGARGPIGTMVGVAIAVALLIAVGNAFGVLISNTDSAAPAGVYRVVSGKFQRGDLVADEQVDVPEPDREQEPRQEYPATPSQLHCPPYLSKVT